LSTISTRNALWNLGPRLETLKQSPSSKLRIWICLNHVKTKLFYFYILMYAILLLKCVQIWSINVFSAHCVRNKHRVQNWVLSMKFISKFYNLGACAWTVWAHTGIGVYFQVESQTNLKFEILMSITTSSCPALHRVGKYIRPRPGFHKASRDRAHALNFNLGYWPQFYCYCTVILSACETWNVSMFHRQVRF